MQKHKHHSQVDLSLAEYSMASVTSEVPSDHLNITFLKGRGRFIKRHNEHYNRHQSLMLTPSQDRKHQNEYVVQIKTPTPCQLPAETSVSKYVIISYYSWQLTPSLNLTCLPCCFTSSIHFYLHFSSTVLTLVDCSIYSENCQSLKPNAISVVWWSRPRAKYFVVTWMILLVRLESVTKSLVRLESLRYVWKHNCNCKQRLDAFFSPI